MTLVPYRQFAYAVEHFPDAVVRSDSVRATCPVCRHVDALSIGTGRCGILLSCYFGCRPDDVAAAAGLRREDLIGEAA
jgi:hypothetical protein